VKLLATEAWTDDAVLFGGSRRAQLALRRRVLNADKPIAWVVPEHRVLLRWPGAGDPGCEAWTAGWRRAD
jgi:hypothetical protein